jgi:hypothetical protein
MIWAGHVARIGRSGMHIVFLWVSQEERNYCEVLDVDERTILDCILEI